MPGLLDGAVEPVEQKQAADAGIKRPLDAQVQTRPPARTSVSPACTKMPHAADLQQACTTQRRNARRQRPTTGIMAACRKPLSEALLLPRAVVLCSEGGKRVAEILHAADRRTSRSSPPAANAAMVTGPKLSTSPLHHEGCRSSSPTAAAQVSTEAARESPRSIAAG